MFNPELSQKYENKKEPEIEKLFGHCFEIRRIENGQLIPVGGDNLFSQEANINVGGDFENMKSWFDKMEDTKSKITENKDLMVWAEKQGLDSNIFASIGSFTKVFEKMYSPSEDTSSSRQKLYQEKKTNIKLSDILGKGYGECAEIAAIAQYWLQQQGIDSSYFSGDVLWEKDNEFSENHSFIIIKQGDKSLIFDPTNPTKTTSGNFPSIYNFDVDFNKEVRKNKKIFIAAKNILSNKKTYFGVNNGTNVDKINILN